MFADLVADPLPVGGVDCNTLVLTPRDLMWFGLAVVGVHAP